MEDDFETRYKTDKEVNEIINEFLDKVVYPKLNIVPIRVDDIENQVAGIDVMFHHKGYIYLCDEKCATRNFNRYLATFCLECLQRQKTGKRLFMDGWFLNKDTRTNSYLFLWVDAIEGDAINSYKDIKKVDVALVRKDKIIEYLNNIGLTESVIRETVDEMLNNAEQSRWVNGIKFSQLFIRENPINILLPRETYKKIADVYETMEF